MKMSFEEYCEDCLDLHIALMSEEQIASARASYSAISSKKPSAQHPDMKRKAGELRNRCERLVIGQRNAISRATDQDAIAAARAAVSMGEKLLTKRSTKAEFIEHAELNSHASRLMNAAK